ncbi:MAG: hypothetical protein ACI9J2_002762, partial [Saprospiraceae bacterium]
LFIWYFNGLALKSVPFGSDALYCLVKKSAEK